MSAAEAMAAATPVVVTRTCPWPEIASHDAGFWVDQTADAIADAVIAVLADEPAAQAMGRRGRALIAGQYTWSHAAAALIERIPSHCHRRSQRWMRGRGLRPMNVIVLTPMMGGADGISEMTRQWVRVLESRVGRDVGTLDVWSLDDAARPDMPAGATARFRTAAGRRLRFASFGLARPADAAARHARHRHAPAVAARGAAARLARRAPRRGADGHRGLEAAAAPGAGGIPSRVEGRGDLHAHGRALSPRESDADGRADHGLRPRRAADGAARGRTHRRSVSRSSSAA